MVMGMQIPMLGPCQEYGDLDVREKMRYSPCDSNANADADVSTNVETCEYSGEDEWR